MIKIEVKRKLQCRKDFFYKKIYYFTFFNFYVLFVQCAEAGTQEHTKRRRKEMQGGGEGQKGKSQFHLPQR